MRKRKVMKLVRNVGNICRAGKIRFSPALFYLYYHQHLLHASYPLARAADTVVWRALFGFMRPQFGMLWYLLPVAESHAVALFEVSSTLDESYDSELLALSFEADVEAFSAFKVSICEFRF